MQLLATMSENKVDLRRAQVVAMTCHYKSNSLRSKFVWARHLTSLMRHNCTKRLTLGTWECSALLSKHWRAWIRCSFAVRDWNRQGAKPHGRR